MSDIIELKIDRPGKLWLSVPIHSDPLGLKCGVNYTDPQGKVFHFFAVYYDRNMPDKMLESILEHSTRMIDLLTNHVTLEPEANASNDLHSLLP